MERNIDHLNDFDVVQSEGKDLTHSNIDDDAKVYDQIINQVLSTLSKPY